MDSKRPVDGKPSETPDAVRGVPSGNELPTDPGRLTLIDEAKRCVANANECLELCEFYDKRAVAMVMIAMHGSDESVEKCIQALAGARKPAEGKAS
jgi:hypothetical protein